MAKWHQLAVELYAAGLKPIEVAKKIEEIFGLTNMYEAVRKFIYRVKKKAEKIGEDVGKESPRVTVQNQEPVAYDSKWDGAQVIKFGLMGDTQMGSKYAQITHLHNFYDRLVKEGITTVYHTGDVVDGLKMRTGHEYELYAMSADEQ